MQLKKTEEGIMVYSAICQVQKMVQTIDVAFLASLWVVLLAGLLILVLLMVASLMVALLMVASLIVAMVTATVMEFWACTTVCVIILFLGVRVSFEPVRDRVQATVLTGLA